MMVMRHCQFAKSEAELLACSIDEMCGIVVTMLVRAAHGISLDIIG